MAGEVDSYGEVAAGLTLRERIARIPKFDKRPGFLDPTKCASPVAIAGKRDSEGWTVLAMIGGFQVTLPPAAARALAVELIAMAELCEGRRW